jgi:hypothetical protein
MAFIGTTGHLIKSEKLVRIIKDWNWSGNVYGCIILEESHVVRISKELF